MTNVSVTARTCRLCDAILSIGVVIIIAALLFALGRLLRENNELQAQVAALSTRPASCPVIAPVVDDDTAKMLEAVRTDLRTLQALALKAIEAPRVPGALRAAVEAMRPVVPGAQKASELECSR